MKRDSRKLSRLLLISSAVCSLLLVSASAYSENGDKLHQTRRIKADYPVTKVTKKIYVIHGPNEFPNKANQGFRDNPGFVLTSRGVVIIDPGSSVYVGEMVLAKIRTVTKDPVIAIFNTHSHGGHWLGNGAIKKAFPNVVIYAHPKMKAMAEAGQGEVDLERFNKMTEGAPKGTRPVIPNKTVDNGDTLTLGNTRFSIHHQGKAHTDNDIMIEVVEEKVMFIGDVVRSKILGLMNEGSFKGNIAAINLALKSRATYFIPGHGPSGGREVIEAYRTYLKTLYDMVRRLYEENLSDFEMKPKVAEALAAYKDWGGFDTFLGPHISQAYLEVEADAF